MTSFMHKPNVSGQSIVDRALAAKHTVSGSGVAKVVCKATTEEVMGPKRKHLDYLLHCTNDSNISIPQLANLLIDRTHNSSWVVVFKALITIHHLMNYGNERFTQYLASNNCHLNLANFTDRGSNLGYSMSVFIRRYARYLNQKASSYRLMAFDFCKVKRGKEDGLLRTMNTEKLLKALPVCHNQLEALVEFEVDVNDLNNGVINGCFMLMFKDLIRLFACYNDGIINLLEKYFDMNKKQCKDALDVYKKFLARADRVCVFLKVAENVGIDKGNIPDLAKAPSSLLDALEQHLSSLENTKKTTSATTTTASAAPPPKPAAGVTAAISSYRAEAERGVAPGAGASLSDISDQERAQILEEEQRQLDLMRQCRQNQMQSTVATTVHQLSAVPPPSSSAASSSSVLSTSLQPATSSAMPPSINNVPQSFIDFADSFDFSSTKNPNDLFALDSSGPPLASSSSTSLAALNGFGGGFDGSVAAVNGGGAFAANNPFLVGNISSSGMNTAAGLSASSAADAGFLWNSNAASTTNYDLISSSRGPGMSTPTALDLFGQNMSSSGSQPILQPISSKPAVVGGASLSTGPSSLISPARTISSAPMSPTNGVANLTGTGGVNSKTDKLIKSNDIDSSLANLAGNLSVKSTNYIKKSEHQWKGDVGEKKLTGGTAGSGWAGPTPTPPPAAVPSSGIYWNQMPPTMPAYPTMQPVYPMMGGGMTLQSVVAVPPAGPYGVPMGTPAMMLVPQQSQAAGWSQQQQQLSANDPFGAL